MPYSETPQDDLSDMGSEICASTITSVDTRSRCRSGIRRHNDNIHPSSSSSSNSSRHISMSDRSSKSSHGSGRKSTATTKSTSPYQERKEDVVGDNDDNEQQSRAAMNNTSPSRSTAAKSLDPDGYYKPEFRASQQVEEYASAARKKASAMTDADFRSRSTTNRQRRTTGTHPHSNTKAGDGSYRSSDGSSSRRSRGSKRRERVEQCKDDLLSHHSQPQPGLSKAGQQQQPHHQEQYVYEYEAEQDLPIKAPAAAMLGSDIIADASIASSVSSMTSVDSYMRQQIMLRELARYKRAMHRQKRQQEEMIMGGEVEMTLVEEDEEDSFYCESYGNHYPGDLNNASASIHSGKYQGASRYSASLSYNDRDRISNSGGGGGARSTRSTSASEKNRNFDSNRSRSTRSSASKKSMQSKSYDYYDDEHTYHSQDYTAAREEDEEEEHTHISGASDYSSHYYRPGNSVSVADHQSITHKSVKSSKSHKSTATTTTKSRQSSFHSGGDTHAQQPVYQLEECCIKHPDILLSDQTNINVWTCMRYCKDEKSGRWITVKKVCRVCLTEMLYQEHDDDHGDEASYPHSHSHHTSKSGGSSKRHRHSHDHHHDDDHTYYSSYAKSHCRSLDETCSMSDEEDIMRDTINVHPTMGEDGNQTPLEREAEAQRRRFIRRLAARAYHFPGNSWCEDWMQYMSNTHLVLGIFYHHPLHPVTGRERCIILLGSVAVGLLMSNLIYLWFVHANMDIDGTVFRFGPGLDVTKLMITLWTVGSVVHTLFDLSVWHIKACTLCRYFGHVSDEGMKCGRTAGVTIVMTTLAFATYLVLLRASSDYKTKRIVELGYNEDIEDEEETADVFFESITLGGGAESFDFLGGYIIEFVLAVFVYNPLILTVVFTGVFGCKGRIPVLGGRPRELAKEQRYAMKRQRYTMPQTLKLGDEEFEADMWGDANQKLATNF